MSNIFPDNAFFEDSTDGYYRGGSWNGEVDGMEATYGAIEPGTEATYSIDEREVISVESGSARVTFINTDGEAVTAIHQPGDLFELPIDIPFTLSIQPGEKFIYGCLYPDCKK